MEDAYVLQLSENKFKELFLCFCGYAQCEPSHSYGPAVRANYIIHYILSGRGIYIVGDKKYELQAGQGFVIEPETSTYYQADKKEPWTYLWVGVGGTSAKEYISDIGLNSEQLTFQSEDSLELKKIVLTMLKNNHYFSPSNEYLLQSLLYQFFSILTKNAVVKITDNESKESIYIKRAINYISNNYSRKIMVTDIASYVCVNRSYLFKLFKLNLNMSPQEFLTQFRLSRAKELLIVTQLSIEGVALSCGYYDTLVFSKTFKKYMGMAPSMYRKTNREEVRKKLDQINSIKI